MSSQLLLIIDDQATYCAGSGHVVVEMRCVEYILR